jgi:sugar phosphate isomerase/epimerase
VRFDQHMLLAAAAEAPAQLLRLLGRQHLGAAALLAWMLALVAAPAAAVWQAERLARRHFALAQHMGRPGVAPPRPPPDAFFRLPDLDAADSGAVLAKMAGAEASACVQPPRLRLG